MADKSVSMTFRLDAELHAAFLAACKAADRSAAQELRSFMRQYIAASLAQQNGAKGE